MAFLRKQVLGLVQVSVLLLSSFTVLGNIYNEEEINNDVSFALAPHPLPGHPPVGAPTPQKGHHHHPKHPLTPPPPPPTAKPPVKPPSPPAKPPSPPPPPHHHHHHPKHPPTPPPPPTAKPPVKPPSPPTKPPSPPPPHHPKHPPTPPTVKPPVKPPSPPAKPPVKPPSPPAKPPSSPPVKPPSPPPAVKPPTHPPAHPVPPRRLVAVQGVVYCKSCKYIGIDTLLGATPLVGATVRLSCNNTKYHWVQDGKTDKNGYFLIAPQKLTTAGSHKCKVFLLASPLATCRVPTNFHAGRTGAILMPTPPPKKPVKKYPFELFTVGPFAFEPSKKLPCKR